MGVVTDAALSAIIEDLEQNLNLKVTQHHNAMLRVYFEVPEGEAWDTSLNRCYKVATIEVYDGHIHIEFLYELQDYFRKDEDIDEIHVGNYKIPLADPECWHTVKRYVHSVAHELSRCLYESIERISCKIRTLSERYRKAHWSFDADYNDGAIYPYINEDDIKYKFGRSIYE
jgi:hypothetical protein